MLIAFHGLWMESGQLEMVWRCGEFLEENPSPPPHIPQYEGGWEGGRHTPKID